MMEHKIPTRQWESYRFPSDDTTASSSSSSKKKPQSFKMATRITSEQRRAGLKPQPVVVREEEKEIERVETVGGR